MRLQSSKLHNYLLVFAVLLLLGAPRAAGQATADTSTPFAQTSAVPARITQAIDETQLVRLKGNVHPLARLEFDQGAVADSMPLTRALILLQRSAEQESALQQLLDDQQNRTSPNFHKWLTPQEFGRQFGPADGDVQTVTDWLTRQGFQGIKVSAGRTTIEFSGTVAQVRNAFHTQIHRFTVNGETRQANVSDPQIPAALTPVVAGIVGLHNFPPKAHVHRLGTFRRTKATGEVKPLFTFTDANGTFYAVGPGDFGMIYNVPATVNGSPAGQGQVIALVGVSNINLQDVIDFRKMFGLPTTSPVNTPKVIVNGPDPGLNGAEIEADLDVEWAGAVAPNAQIILVVTEEPFTSVGAFGVDLSALYIIDNNLAPVMSESFGACETAIGTAGNALETALWQQASAQGITAMVSSGDDGSAGCDPSPTNPLVATQGLAVSGFASTPFNVAVGGTDFNQNSGNISTFWNTSNNATTQASAKGYIPEITWNDTCAAGGQTAGCPATTITNDATNIFPGVDAVAGSGGASATHAKPSWQSGTGVPSDKARDIPDVSLFAGNGRHRSFYIICQMDANTGAGSSATSCDLNSPFTDFQGVGGTSASSPAFAGIMALVNQKTGQRQGNANYVLYPLASKAGSTCASAASPASTCIFYDIPAGSNISVACQGGTPQCSNTSTAASQFGIMTTTTGGTTPAYNTTAGYDLATGLGSVNVTNLVNNWTSASFTPSTTTFTLNGGTPVSTTHGTGITVSGTVKPSSGTGTPTGIVELIQGTAGPGPVIDAFTLTNGSYSGTTTMLPGTNGTSYQMVAHYGGDGTFAASDSLPQTVNSVAKENSAVTVSFVTFTAQGVPILSTGPTPVSYGSPYILRVDVTNAGKQPCSTSTTPIPCPNGSVTELDNGQPLNDFLIPNTSTATNSTTLNNFGFIEDQPIQLNGGSHSITASYGGDNSYNSQSASNTLSVTITPAATTSTLTPSATTVQTNQGVTLSATINSTSNSSVGPTGNITFKDGTTTIGTATAVPAGATATAGASATATLNTSFTTTGMHSLTAVYAGDQNYATSTSGAVTLTVGSQTTTAVTSSSTSIASGGSVTLTAKVSTTSNGAGPTGTVQFKNGSTALSTAVTCTPTAGTSTTTAFCTATLTTTLSFLAPPSAPNRIPKIPFQPVMLVAAVLLLLILIGSKHIPAPYRRPYACACLLLILGLTAGLVGCGGNGGGGTTPHSDTITAVYSGDATYAGSTSPAITITVQ